MEPEPEPQGREPMFNAPWPSLVVVASILGTYAWEATSGGEAAASALAFAPVDLDHGRWLRIVTVLFVHGGWAHAIVNALGALAFGPPVARALGRGPKGAVLFFAFYLVCGALSSLAYAAGHLHSAEQVVGASGAVSGLMGAASRMLGRGEGLAPLFSRSVLSLGAGWILVNAIMVVSGFTPLMEGARIAWEAHVGGFVAGALLIGPFVAFAGAPLREPDDRADVT